MQKYFYPIFKLPDYYIRDYQKQELPLWVKWWLLGKAGRKLSEILTGSEFTLLNTVSRKFKIFELSGRTEQEQLSGKNLFELTTPTISEGTKVGDLANGYWYKGNTSSSTGEYANSKGWLTLPFTFEANENHVLTFNVKQITAGYTNKIALRYEDTATNLLEITLTNTSTRYNVLLNPSVNKRVYIALSSNEIQLTDIQVEQGSTATSYEPYCGGIPAPNPRL